MKQIEVKIMGQAYLLAAPEGGEQRLQQAVQRVDAAMCKIRDAGRIKARIRPNIVFLDKVSGDPTAEVEVRAAADGTIVGRKLLKSSGVPAYDEAVLRAIDKTEVLPRDVDGRVPSALLLVFRANE